MSTLQVKGDAPLGWMCYCLAIDPVDRVLIAGNGKNKDGADAIRCIRLSGTSDPVHPSTL
jgi:hypothetical protein